LKKTHVPVAIISALCGAAAALAVEAIATGHPPHPMREATRPNGTTVMAPLPARPIARATANEALAAPESWKQYPPLTDY
jgi:hypothetical protein